MTIPNTLAPLTPAVAAIYPFTLRASLENLEVLAVFADTPLDLWSRLHTALDRGETEVGVDAVEREILLEEIETLELKAEVVLA